MATRYLSDRVPNVTGCVYLARCKINQKVYAGKTTHRLSDRIYNHTAESARNNRRPFCLAVNEYGVASFDWIVLFHGGTEGQLCEFEKYFIRLYESQNPDIGYNVSDGGDGALGCKRSAETLRLHRVNDTRHTYGGETLTVREWADKCGLRECTMRARLKKWPIEKAVSVKFKHRHKKGATRYNAMKYEANGMSMTLPQWSEFLGTGKTTLDNRLKKRGTERALTTPLRKKRKKNAC